MNEKKYILSDDELLDLSEFNTLTEGDGLEELLEEARHVAEAVRQTGERLNGMDKKARVLFYMRAFYFLGILRGGEAYRFYLMMGNDDSARRPRQIPYTLDGLCTEIFADDLRIPGKPSETLKAIYKAVGLGK